MQPHPATNTIVSSNSSGLRIHGIQTGWVQVKTAHYRLRHPAALRLLFITLGRRWTAPLPILTWLIEHPEGLILIDTGESAQAATDLHNYMACDPGSRWFFQRNLRFALTPDEEISAQLSKLGKQPDDVRWIVQTHLHSDHAGGLRAFPNAQIVVARSEVQGHQRCALGGVPCLWPQPFTPQLVDYAHPPVGPFSASQRLTSDGAVVLVPTPGHSYGHQSVLLRADGCTYCFAGDVVFSESQLLKQELQGISHDVRRAHASVAALHTYVKHNPTVVLPTHDQQALERLQQRRTTQL